MKYDNGKPPNKKGHITKNPRRYQKNMEKVDEFPENSERSQKVLKTS